MSRCPETEEYEKSLKDNIYSLCNRRSWDFRYPPIYCAWKCYWHGGKKIYGTDCGKLYPQEAFGNYCKHCGQTIVEVE